MSKPSVEQVRLRHRGREFHFVSYEGRPADLKKHQAPTEPAWFLMNGGRRWEVMPHRLDQTLEERDRLFTVWLERFVFAAVPEKAPDPEPASPRQAAAGDDLWFG